MRLRKEYQKQILKIVKECLGPNAKTFLCGSRTDDTARGGDVDIMVVTNEPIEHPARVSAQLEARIMRTMHGRKVDVLLKAPNLRHGPMHDVGLNTGILLE